MLWNSNPKKMNKIIMKKIVSRRNILLFLSSIALFSVIIISFSWFLNKNNSFFAIKSYASQIQENVSNSLPFLKNSEENPEKFTIADATSNACTRGTKRCVGDTPQRCDTTGYSHSFGWHNILENGMDCSDMNKICHEGECVDFKSIELISQPQTHNINVNFNKGGIEAESLGAGAIFDKWKRFKVDKNVNWDFYPYSEYPYAPDFSPGYPYTGPSASRVWVGNGLGPAISHCPVVNEGRNYSEEVSLPVGEGYESCGFVFNSSDFPRIDYGQNCHRDHWQVHSGENPTIDIGTAYKDYLYNGVNYDYVLENTPWNSSNPYEGDSVMLDCEAIAQAATEGPNSASVSNPNPAYPPPPVHPNECIPGETGNGVWDWYLQRPNCTYFTPEMEREKVCLELWDNCVPQGEGECSDFSCEGGTIDWGGCVQIDIENQCECPEPSGDIPDTYATGFFSGQNWQDHGSCSWSDGRSAIGESTEIGGCERCSNSGNSETCNNTPYSNMECSQYECSFTGTDECSCEWNNCQKGYNSCTDTQCNAYDDYIEYDSSLISGCGSSGTWVASSTDEFGTVDEQYCSSGTYADGGCVKEECTEVGTTTCDEMECTNYNNALISCDEWEVTATNSDGVILTEECVDEDEADGGYVGRACSDMTCISHETIWEDMECESSITVPEDYTYHEAEDCCKRWYWGCSAGCVSNTVDCREGYAVGWRPDYRFVTFSIGGAGDDCTVSNSRQFVIELFVDSNSTPRDLEVLIRNAQDGLYTPHYEYTEDEYEDRINEGCSRTSVGDLKDIILGAGKLVSSSNYSNPDYRYFDFDNYLDSISGYYIADIEFSKSR